jgi:pSer/pThr/pTyr-binding forkhead associated (FHA) protein
MPARLFSKWGETKGEEFLFNEQATIGRSTAATIVLESAAISSQHARILFDDQQDCYILEDLGSLNGTELDGMPVTQAERLGSLHLVSFGHACEFIFQRLESGVEQVQTGESTQPAAPDRGTVVDGEMPLLPDGLREMGATEDREQRSGTVVDQDIVALPEIFAPTVKQDDSETADRADGGEPVYLELTNWQQPRPRFGLREGDNVIGRAEECDVTIESSEVSRRHAVLKLSGGRVTLRDEGSSNHTYIDDQRIDGEVEVAPRARLRFGAVEARLLGLYDGEATDLA